MNKIRPTHRPQYKPKQLRGFTLVEMLISSAISLILIAGVLTIAMGVMGNSAENLKRTHLIQELRDVMAVMVRDIRRAGFNAGGISVLFANNEFTQGNSFLTVRDASNVIQTQGSCIAYAYDYRDHPNGRNGILDIGADIDERSGFRLKKKGIQMFKGINGAVDCAGSGWEGLTSSSITITNLEFNASEECFNVTVVPFQKLASCATAIPVNNLKAKLISIAITITGETIISGSKKVTRTITDSVTVRNSQTTLSAGP